MISTPLSFLRAPVKMRLIPFLLLLLATYAFPTVVRLHQIETWKQTPGQFFVDETPMMTTVDAYYWLRWAREIRADTIRPATPDVLRNYPEGKNYGNPQQPAPPLLSVLIAKAAFFTGGNVDMAALYLVALLGGLFTLPFALYFYRIGFTLAGILGGALAGVSFEYFVRTCVGRVDTDCLNLFFMSLIPLAILMTGVKDEFKTIIAAGIAGAGCYLFNWWYGHASFIAFFFPILVAFLILNKKPAKIVVLCIALFIVMTKPSIFFSQFHGALNMYQRLFPGDPATAVAAGSAPPDAAQTITELERLQFMPTFGLILSSPKIALAGFMLCLLFFVSNPDRMLPLVPALLIGGLSFTKGRRFAMYLAPFVGVGFGYLITIAAAALESIRLRGRTMQNPPAANVPLWRDAVLIGVCIAAFVVLSPYTAASLMPGAKIEPTIFAAIKKFKSVVPEGSRIWNLWNFGYLITDTTGRATYNDGGMPVSSKTFFFSHGYSSSSPRELYNTMSYIDRNGEEGLITLAAKHADFRDVIAAIASDATPPPDDIYLTFTGNMLSQFPSINMLGDWDFAKNQGQTQGYDELHCSEIKNGVLKCKEVTIDTINGLVNGKTVLDKTLALEKGRIVKALEKNHPGGYVLELLMNGNRIERAFLLNAKVFASNFNQMFLLGRYDPALYEPVFDAFPALRAYRVKTNPAPYTH